jgi:DNA-binding transcriptional LysR family regulator
MDTARQLESLHNKEIDLEFRVRAGKADFQPAYSELKWQNISAEPLVAALPACHTLLCKVCL